MNLTLIHVSFFNPIVASAFQDIFLYIQLGLKSFFNHIVASAFQEKSIYSQK